MSAPSAPLFTSDNTESPGWDAREERVAATSEQPSDTSSFSDASGLTPWSARSAYACDVRISYDTNCTTEYGTIFARMAGSPDIIPPPRSAKSRGSASHTSDPKVGSATRRMRVASSGQRNVDATVSARVAASPRERRRASPESAAAVTGFNTSYRPYLNDPWIAYPTSVDPSPDARAPGPSVERILPAAEMMLEPCKRSSVCSRVFTTSIGTVHPWLADALIPPARKNLYASGPPVAAASRIAPTCTVSSMESRCAPGRTQLLAAPCRRVESTAEGLVRAGAARKQSPCWNMVLRHAASASPHLFLPRHIMSHSDSTSPAAVSSTTV
mmetsp:Transcript_17656/g.42555  ORF Transcript_17656/g.42555 Transcript_17656/m.42555 type:complete len:328 (-) Transcript_17656:99-1082(-)